MSANMSEPFMLVGLRIHILRQYFTVFYFVKWVTSCYYHVPPMSHDWHRNMSVFAVFL